MITAAVDNHGVENLQDTSSKSHYAGAAYNVRFLCSEEDMAEGVVALKAFFRLQREPNLKSGNILVIIRMLRNSCEGRQHIQFTRPSPSTVQRMQGKLTSSSGA